MSLGVQDRHTLDEGRAASPAVALAASGRRSPGPARPGSLRRWRAARLALAVPTVVVLLALVAVAVLWSMTPSVADAGRRVETVQIAHSRTPLEALPSPDRVGRALIATEDSRFRSTPGIDPLSAARVAWAALRGKGDTGGAGLAQQLAKNLYEPSGPAVWREAQQVELALKLEASYSKDEILRMYLSAVYYGHGYYGVTQAAWGYFGVAPSQLSWGQAALLAGLVLAPSADDPRRHPGRATARQQHVLGRLVATGVLGAARAQSIGARGLQLSPVA